MNLKQSLILLITVFFSGVLSLSAQERVVQGMVTTFDSIPLIGAEITVISSKQTVKSDTLGRFTVTVQKEDKLRVTAKGFNTEKFKLDEKIKVALINLKLKSGDQAREYAIGYGYVSDAEKLNAVVQMTSKDVNFSQYTNMYDLIRGRFGGVQIDTNGDIIIRGVNSINSSSAALIILDGIPIDNSTFANIPTATVKSVNVIKDGSAAIYGARGANGVVLVETKKGGDE